MGATGHSPASSALAFGGGNPGPLANTEDWTGAGANIGAWSTGGDLNQMKYNTTGVATDNEAALNFSGNYPPGDNYAAQTENYNGTNWTEVNDLNTARELAASAGT